MCVALCLRACVLMRVRACMCVCVCIRDKAMTLRACMYVCVCMCILRPHITTQEELRAEYYFANLPKQAQTFPAANPPLQPMVLTPVASHSGTRTLPPLPPPSASLRAPSPAGSALVCSKCVARGFVLVPACVCDEHARACKAAHVCNQCESTAFTTLCVRSQS